MLRKAVQINAAVHARTTAVRVFLSSCALDATPPDRSSSQKATVLPFPSGWTSGPESSTA